MKFEDRDGLWMGIRGPTTPCNCAGGVEFINHYHMVRFHRDAKNVEAYEVT